jgi:copper chaperone CopZ
MKQLAILFSASLFLVLVGCGPTGNASSEFWVRGNCNMCKSNIEEAVSAVKGVANVDYDLETNLVLVSYDSTQVDVNALHLACAGAGYDTKLEKAVAEAYEDLPKCCKKPADI